MPPRSLLLNVSITAKGIDEREKIQVVDSVKEVNVDVEDVQINQVVKGRQERIDSAASIQTSPLHDIATIPNNAITTSPTESDPCTIPTPLDSPIAMSPDPALPLLQCASCGFINFPDTTTPTLRRCSRCKLQRYCSRQCQKSHWPVHKRTCSPPSQDTGFPTKAEKTAAIEPVSIASPPFLSSSSSPTSDVEMTGMDVSMSYGSPSDVSSPGTMSSFPVSREWTPERI